MTVRMVELFAGISAQATAMENLGIDFTSVVSEIDQRAYEVYCAIHGPTENLGDITKIKHLPPCDLITYSFPCIRGDQLVNTSKGKVKMKDLKVGDEVLTHKNRYRKITAFRYTGIHETIQIRCLRGHGKLVCTKNHRLYVRKDCNSEPYWEEAGNLTPGNYQVGYLFENFYGTYPIEYECQFAWEWITNIRECGRSKTYDISVEEDESFVANNIIVHNCQDLSIAGKRTGMAEGSGTRSSLLWEVGRLLEDLATRNELPEHLVMENVDAILNQKNRPYYEEWKRRLDRLGYITTDAILNAKDFGVPQNRKRCFAVSVLKKSKGGKIGMAYTMPKGRPLDKRLKDVLESNVPESYYLSQERIANYERHRLRQEANGRGFGWKPMNPNKSKVAHTFTGNQSKHTGTFLIEGQSTLNLTDNDGKTVPIQEKSETNVKMEYDRLPDEKYDIESRVYDTSSLSPALRTKSLNVKIKEEEK